MECQKSRAREGLPKSGMGKEKGGENDMNEFKECIKMLDSIIATSAFAMFTGKLMTPEDYQKLKAWVVAVEKRLAALEEAQRMREGEL